MNSSDKDISGGIGGVLLLFGMVCIIPSIFFGMLDHDFSGFFGCIIFIAIGAALSMKK